MRSHWIRYLSAGGLADICQKTRGSIGFASGAAGSSIAGMGCPGSRGTRGGSFMGGPSGKGSLRGVSLGMGPSGMGSG